MSSGLPYSFCDGRFEIQHKLGWCGFSTAWLVEDTEYIRSTRETPEILTMEGLLDYSPDAPLEQAYLSYKMGG